jgi:hypothetical protein
VRRREFEGEFDQILRMLREHAYLQYAPSRRLEYEARIAATFVHFRNLVLECAGIELPFDKEAAEDLSRLRGPSCSEAARTLARAGSRLVASGREDAAQPWVKAAAALRALR